MDAPTYTPPPPDPQIAANAAKAQADSLTAAQATAGIDTASLMARYGTSLAMGGAATGSPLTASSPPQFTGAFAPIFNPMAAIVSKGAVGGGI